LIVRPAQHSRPRQFHLPGWVAFLSFVAIAAFFFWTEHRAHLLGALPYILVFLALVVHVLMHRRHGNPDDQRSQARRARDDSSGGRR
jgi:hypothetical protein